MSIRKLRQVISRSDDFDRDIPYWQSLGLELQFRDGDRFAQLAAGDVSMALACAEESFDLEPGRWLPVFEVDDIEETLHHVAEAGGETGEIRDMGSHGRTALIRQAAGPSAALFQRA